MIPTIVSAQQISLDTRFSLNFQSKNLEDVIKQLADDTGISFSFTQEIFSGNIKIDFQSKNARLENVLNDIFLKNDIEWLIFQNSIILRKQSKIKSEYLIKGQVTDQDGTRPIPFVSIGVKGNTLQGVICNENGQFELRVNESQLNDSVEFSSVGFYRKSIITKQLLQSTNVHVMMNSKPEPIEPIIVCARDYKTETVGNDALFPIGTLYLDTHGQQTALLIENKKGREGEICSIQYYLSKKGNTSAPFRVRIYTIDTVSGRPVDDLLNDALIVKPSKNGGWFSVDLSAYHIMIPSQGFFAAIEGIYPSVYSESADTTNSVNFDPETDDFDETPSIVSYGQKIGYTKSRKGKNNTWHYSLSHTWFQLRKNNFGVMIAADIRYLKKRRSAKIK